MDYKNSGVDIEAGYKSVELMKEHIKKTMRSEVLTNIGGFSGAFSMEKFKGMEKPTLVSGTDGVIVLPKDQRIVEIVALKKGSVGLLRPVRIAIIHKVEFCGAISKHAGA